MKTPSTANPWKMRFFCIFTGQSLSLIGSALTQFVLMWWIAQTTNSPKALAFAGIAGLLPMALIGPFAGVVADRFSRRLIMIVADTITAICMIVIITLFASGTIVLPQVYALMAIRSTMQAFQQPAARACSGMLVPQNFLPRAAGLGQVVEGVMTIGAAPLGAIALSFLSFEGALMIDVVTAFLGILPLLFLKIPQPARDKREEGEQLSFPSVIDDFHEGARYIIKKKGLLLAFALESLVVLIILPTFSLTPLFVKERLGGGIETVALMELLAGIGIIGGGMFIGLFGSRIRSMSFVLANFALSCASVAFTGLTPLGCIPLAAAWWFVSGLTYSMGNAPFIAVLQSEIPNRLQGRIFSLLTTSNAWAATIGLWITGMLAESFGVRSVFIGAGLLSSIPYLFAFFSPSVMKLGKSHPVVIDIAKESE